ncbi:hypothetical protein SEA_PAULODIABOLI_233 [Microbacterium phage PauloDiaboli]|nr:hypothetical protein SEA_PAULODIABOLI_233 [Microbacterium phage PauloDiaboli]QWY84040.1 hypothetical protein SEA_A3WALLY_233 [Microbacterium phage A3Wally]
MNCPICGRFMKLSGYYSSDSYDSWVDSWYCTSPNRHP